MELIDRMRVNGEIYGALNAGQITSDTYAALLERIESIESIENAPVRIWHDNDVDAIMDDIDKASASDVAPVRRGVWETIHRPDLLKCSVCHGAYMPEKWWKYCPVCGARMDGQAQ